jgi:hypothetical protein
LKVAGRVYMMMSLRCCRCPVGLKFQNLTFYGCRAGMSLNVVGELENVIALNEVYKSVLLH